MREPAEFDAFYKDARDRLLVQTFCLTGDLNASRRAVRDAFIVAWHRWRKVSRLDDPESSVRPHAWRLAQRRHTGRVWHRERDLDPDVLATLDALGKLSVNQRKALLLTQLAAVSMPQMAREIGLTIEDAERELQAGAAQLSLVRGVPAPMISTVLEPVGASALARAKWSRATIVRRAGAARRRTHTVIGVVGVAAAVAVSGSLVNDAAGVRPTLHRAEAPQAKSTSIPGPDPESSTGPPAAQLTEATLLSLAQLQQQLPGRDWKLKDTDTDPSDNTVELPCQPAPFADGKGEAGLVRRFVEKRPGASRKKPGAPRSTLVQLTEMSRRTITAKRAYDTAIGWFAGCEDTRVQVLSTQTPEKVGDEATQLVLRSWADPVTTYVVDVVRSGVYTTVTMAQLPGESPPDAVRFAGLARTAVDGLCDLEGAGGCSSSGAGKARLVQRGPVPVGEVPALLSVVDLPPIRDLDRPWAATNPKQPQPTPSVTPCAPEDFAGSFEDTAFTRGATRSFLVPEAGLPAEFGLTETVAALPKDRAARFISKLRERIAACPENQLGTDVRRLAADDDDDVSMSAWRLDIRVTRKQTLTFYLAALRHGTGVGQLGFVPANRTLPDDAFVALARRAADRLGELPAPKPARDN